MFFRSNKGSVSVFFMIILSAILLLNAVLIELARVKIAERQTEAALHAAMRSVLSSYDSSLHDYGLFGISSAADGERIFKHVLERSFSQVNEQSFQLMLPHWDEQSSELSHRFTLGYSPLFKQQILEEMKYKAPIEFTLGILDKFEKTDLNEQMEEASEFTKNADHIERLIQRRDNNLILAWEQTKRMLGPSGTMADYHTQYSNRLQQLNNLAVQIGNRSRSQIESQLLALQMMEPNEGTQAAIVALMQWLDRIIQYQSLTAELHWISEMDLGELFIIQESIEQYLDRAQEINGQINEQLDLMLEKETTGEESIQHTALEMVEYIQRIENSFFVQYKVGISNAIGLFSGFANQLDFGALSTGRDFTVRYDRLISANSAYATAAQSHYSSLYHNEEERVRRQAELQDLKDEQRGRIGQVLAEIKELFAKCDGNDAVIYSQLNHKVQSYKEYNQLQSEEDDVAVRELDDPDELGLSAMNLMDDFRLSLLHYRDKAYVNEYALTKFNHRTSDHIDVQKLKDQEAEYILYGLNSCFLNHSAAYAEIFSIRLAIRTMEVLLNPNKAMLRSGSPLLSLLWAIAEGTVLAFKDMKNLTDGKEVRLSDKLPEQITLNYEDYLRIFMIIHGREQNMLIRMQALIDLNTGRDLKASATHIYGTTSTHTKRWFFPFGEQTIVKQLYSSY